MAGAFDRARAAPVPPDRVDLSGDVGQNLGRGVVPGFRGKARRAGGGAAGDAQDPGEGDPVGVEVGGFGGAGDQRGQRVMDQQSRPDLLVDQLGQARAQDLTRAAQVGRGEQLIARPARTPRPAPSDPSRLRAWVTPLAVGTDQPASRQRHRDNEPVTLVATSL